MTLYCHRGLGTPGPTGEYTAAVIGLGWMGMLYDLAGRITEAAPNEGRAVILRCHSRSPPLTPQGCPI
jgi:hypothetical protein